MNGLDEGLLCLKLPLRSAAAAITLLCGAGSFLRRTKSALPRYALNQT
jgi:hypothetical protein